MRSGVAGLGPHSNFGAQYLVPVSHTSDINLDLIHQAAVDLDIRFLFAYNSNVASPLGFAFTGQPSGGPYGTLDAPTFFSIRGSFPEGARRIHKGSTGSVRRTILKFVLGKILGHF